MTDQSYAAQVAADVAARYGMPVAQDAVQIIPRGMSSVAHPVWDGSQLVYREESRDSWRKQRAASKRNYITSPKVVERRLQVARLHAEGLHDAAIAEALEVESSIIHQDRTALKLIANPCLLHAISNEQRNSRMRALIAQGYGADGVAAEMGLSIGQVRLIARTELQMPFGHARKVKPAPKAAVPRKAVARAVLPVIKPPRVRKVKVETIRAPSAAKLRLAALQAMIDGLGRDLTRADLDAYSLRIGRTITQLRRDIEVLGLAWPRPPNWKQMAGVRLSPVARLAVRDKRRADIAAMDLTQVTVAQLVQRFEVSKETISRDLFVLGRCTMIPARGLHGVIKDAFDTHRAAIAKLHAEGADRAEIGRATGLHRNAVSRHLKALGLDLPRGYVNPWAGRDLPGTTDRVKDMMAQIAALRTAGKTYAEIMAATGLRKASVSRYLMQLGLTGQGSAQPAQVAA
ncbi:hypothetical protein GCM10010873_26780 [Cypionkella aquatica]|uniref:Uncharacterized protein n=1 Tax=Cypionkella aquatica TaxID=1756042 RepID=A0AA37TU80_9RHOB|nr:hypothetical protein [Cypionkella aquatica]GLS87704.1 hypothetical protein GCM10010873_26780 [Cypionkella aquatica]